MVPLHELLVRGAAAPCVCVCVWRGEASRGAALWRCIVARWCCGAMACPSRAEHKSSPCSIKKINGSGAAFLLVVLEVLRNVIYSHIRRVGTNCAIVLLIGK